MIPWQAGVILAIFLTGCSTTFKETHYFRSEVSTPGAIPNYFRLTVEGSAAISSARYISGYFDEDTINAYFNEYTQPRGAALYPSSSTPAKGDATGGAAKSGSAESGSGGKDAAAGGTAKVEPVAAGLKGTKLVMILSSNSDEVANQIGALAASKQFTASLAGLVARDQFTLADQAEQQLQIDRSRAKTTAALGDLVLASIPANASVANATQQLLVLINAIARDLGYQGAAFSGLDDAARWLNDNRTHPLGGAR
jgi:hypothetical protein